MYFPYFITYITIGLILGLVVFFWSLYNGQFQDQERARFLPLAGLPREHTPQKRSGWGPMEIYVLAFLSAMGLAASAATLIFALI